MHFYLFIYFAFILALIIPVYSVRLVLIPYMTLQKCLNVCKLSHGIKEKKRGGGWLFDSKISCSVSTIPFRFVIFVLLFFHSCWWIASKLTGHQGHHLTDCCHIHSLQAVLDFSSAFPWRWIGTKLPVVNSQNCISFMIAFSKRVRIGKWTYKLLVKSDCKQYCISPVSLANQAQGPKQGSKNEQCVP